MLQGLSQSHIQTASNKTKLQVLIQYYKLILQNIIQGEGKPGMGKALQDPSSCTNLWVCFIEFTDHTNSLKANETQATYAFCLLKAHAQESTTQRIKQEGNHKTQQGNETGSPIPNQNQKLITLIGQKPQKFHSDIVNNTQM